MDLGAYIQIEDLEQIAKDNGINIPRLRGYRLMSQEQPLSKTEIDKIKQDSDIDTIKSLIRSAPFWNIHSDCHWYNERTDRLIKYYLVSEKSKEGHTIYTDIRWDRIHSKKRKILKYAIKRKHKHIQHHCDTWNKYAGRDDVLYIHSRMGGNNWENYEGKDSILNAPWFLDRVDDYFDSTYCDFYARIDTKENKHE